MKRVVVTVKVHRLLGRSAVIHLFIGMSIVLVIGMLAHQRRPYRIAGIIQVGGQENNGNTKTNNYSYQNIDYCRI
jgi:hypothetical protein